MQLSHIYQSTVDQSEILAGSNMSQRGGTTVSPQPPHSQSDTDGQLLQRYVADTLKDSLSIDGISAAGKRVGS